MRNIAFITTTTIMALVLVACEGVESEGIHDEGRSYDLRGGATLTLAAGTELDADELESRAGYGATLTDPDATSWFVSVARAEQPTLAERGFASFPFGDDLGYHGTLWGEGEDGDQCHVYLPFTEDSYVRLERLVDDVDCPESIDEIADWLPSVAANGDESFLRAFGDVVGTFNGITAYSNGWVTNVTNQYSTVGMMWQCVEYVNRYYYQKLAHKNLKHTGNAKDYYGTAASKDLVAYPNGGSTPPAVGDMLASNGNGANGNYGHIAIVREVGANYVKVIHQNWSNTASDNSMTLSMSVVNGKYTVSAFAGSYPVTGWLRRKPGCMPTITSVTPTTATLNQSKQFTATGSCLSTTTTAPWIAECANLVVNQRTTTSLVFTCTPSYSKGSKAGVIKHNTDGTVLKNFTLTVN